jgi:hypothetical protein
LVVSYEIVRNSHAGTNRRLAVAERIPGESYAPVDISQRELMPESSWNPGSPG